MSHPVWLKVKLVSSLSHNRIRQLNRCLNLNTVCEQAACPNISTCWAKSEVTYLLLGKDCTRGCKFCNVSKFKPRPPDPLEPEAIAQAAKRFKLSYLVLTSVTRDDLMDKGARHFLTAVRRVKKLSPNVRIELLVPDFQGLAELIGKVACSGAEVIGHNIETVRSLYAGLRPSSDYDVSLRVLESLKVFNPHLITKSALLLGLGENDAEVIDTIKDLRKAKVDIIYFGQYLSPSARHWPVRKFYSPDEFMYFKDIALELGFKTVVSEPLARSSWNARESYENFLLIAKR